MLKFKKSIMKQTTPSKASFQLLSVKFLPIFFLLLPFYVVSQIPNGYYNTANSKTGSLLKTALFNIIDGHTTVSYSGLYTAYATTDKKSNGKVWDMYSDKPGQTPPYEYSFGSGTCGTYSGEGDCWNREHSTPASWFSDATPMYSDLFNVYPTDGYVNNRRSNYPFGEVSAPTWTSLNGSKVGNCSFSGYTGTVFEPIDEYKGDFARSYFYMATRYEDKISNWTSAMYAGNSFPVFSTWALNMLLKWHQQDPVSQKELDRNNAVYLLQNNRNPYIDHPEYVECVWSNCQPVSQLSFTSNPALSTTESVFYQYDISATDASSPMLVLTFNILQKPSWLTFAVVNGKTAKLYGNVPTGAIGTYGVSISVSNGSNTITQNYNLNVQSIQSQAIFSSDFATCPTNGWITFSKASNKNWGCGTSSGNNYMNVNGYGGDVASDDWLITPSVNLNNFKDEILSFKTWTKFSDTPFPQLKIKYSTNYSGSGSPDVAVWTELNFTSPANNSQVWTNSGNISLNSISGNSVYFAFHYTSSGTTSNTCSQWEIDDVSITGTALTSAKLSSITKLDLKVYPTVSSTSFCFDFQTIIEKNCDIEIYNIQGKLVWKDKYTNISKFYYNPNQTITNSQFLLYKIQTDTNIYKGKLFFTKNQ